jgi:hypothetical protein
MAQLSVGYEGLVHDLSVPLIAAEVGKVLIGAVGDRYERMYPDCSLVQFIQSGATYLFDLASAAGAGQEDRTVAAWTTTPATVGKRDIAYQRGFPLAADPGSLPVDRGHLIPNLSGGEFGPNIFRQDRSLNRGWSQEGRRFRAMEREAAIPGTFYFGHLLYADDTAYPMEIEIGLLRGNILHVERFQNRRPHGR